MYIIIVGCGRLGSNLAKELSDFGHNICIIDRDKEKLAVLGSGFNGKRIIGIEFDNDNLIQSGIKETDALLAITPDDNINITVSMIADRIYHVPQVIARVNDPNRNYVYEKLGIETINPVRLGAELLFSRLTIRSCNVITQLDSEFQIIDLMISKKNSTTIVEEIEKKYSCIISGVNRGGCTILPKKEDQIHCGDRILCTINKNEKDKLLKSFSKEMSIWNP